MIIFVHTPKCAGTSFMQGLREAYGEAFHFHSAAPFRREYLKRVRRRSRRGRWHVWWHRKRILREVEIIYGHFKAHEFDFLGRGGNRLRYGMFFRDPVEMVASYYHHIQKPGKKRFSVEMRGCRGIEEFAGLEPIRNYFAIHLGRKKIADLDFVGIVEHYGASLDLYASVFGKRIRSYRENVGRPVPVSHRESIGDAESLRRIEALQERNIDIYRQALSRHRELVKRHAP